MSLIGRPVEAFVQVILDENTSQTDKTTVTNETYLDCILPLNDNKVCQIQVFPVIDQSRRHRLDEENRYSCMSHILVQVSHSGAINKNLWTQILPFLDIYNLCNLPLIVSMS